MDIRTIPYAGDELYVEVTTETKHSELLAQLNERFGILLTAADIVEGDIPPAGGAEEVVGFDLVASEGNLVWADKVRVVRVGELTDISTLVLVTDLDGLHAPEVVLMSEEGAGDPAGDAGAGGEETPAP